MLSAHRPTRTPESFSFGLSCTDPVSTAPCKFRHEFAGSACYSAAECCPLHHLECVAVRAVFFAAYAIPFPYEYDRPAARAVNASIPDHRLHPAPAPPDRPPLRGVSCVRSHFCLYFVRRLIPRPQWNNVSVSYFLTLSHAAVRRRPGGLPGRFGNARGSDLRCASALHHAAAVDGS